MDYLINRRSALHNNFDVVTCQNKTCYPHLVKTSSLSSNRFATVYSTVIIIALWLDFAQFNKPAAHRYPFLAGQTPYIKTRLPSSLVAYPAAMPRLGTADLRYGVKANHSVASILGTQLGGIRTDDNTVSAISIKTERRGASASKGFGGYKAFMESTKRRINLLFLTVPLLL